MWLGESLLASWCFDLFGGNCYPPLVVLFELGLYFSNYQFFRGGYPTHPTVLFLHSHVSRFWGGWLSYRSLDLHQKTCLKKDLKQKKTASQPHNWQQSSKSCMTAVVFCQKIKEFPRPLGLFLTAQALFSLSFQNALAAGISLSNRLITFIN